MGKNRFVDDSEVQRIDLGEGDWVEIPKRLSYGFVSKFAGMEGSKMEIATKILVQLLKAWNLKDGEGNTPKINPETVKTLDYETVMAIMAVVEPMISADPKALVGSKKQ